MAWAPTGAAPSTRGDVDQDQERKILQQQVTQAIHEIVHVHKEMQGVPTEGVAGGQVDEFTTRGLTKAQRRHATEAEECLLSRDGSEAKLGGFKVEFSSGLLSFATELVLLFVSCGLPVLALAGRNVLTILLVGVVLSYILDFTNCKQMTLMAIWFTILFVVIGIYLTNIALVFESPLTMLIIANSCLYLFLVGCFATVQFRWFQLQSPEISLAAERLLLGLTPVICLPLLFSTIVTFCGAQLAPFLLAILLVVLHNRFYSLRKSSFKEALTPEATDEEYINGRLEALLFTIITLFIPTMVHVAIFHRAGLTSFHQLNILALVALPALYLFWKPEKSLWFLYKNPYWDNRDRRDVYGLTQMRKAVLLAAYLVVLHTFVYRVIFGRYAYIFTAISPPFNVILILLGSYAMSIMFYFSFKILAEDPAKRKWNSMRFGAILMSVVGTVCFGLVLGVPSFMLPLLALSVVLIAVFCYDPTQVNLFILFATNTMFTLSWWMYKSFSFLNVDLPILGGTVYISLTQLGAYLIWLYTLECAIFAVGVGNGGKRFYTMMLLQACGVAFIEHILYSQPEELYPFLFVVLTSAWGVFVSFALKRNKRLTKSECSMLSGLYFAKLYLFAVCVTSPDPDSDLYSRALRSGELISCFCSMGLMVATLFELHLERKERRRRTTTGGLSLIYAVAAVIVAIVSRNSIVLGFLELTTGSSEVMVGRLFGLTIAFAGLLQLPLAAVLPPAQSKSRRIAMGMLISGCIIALLDPKFLFDDAAASELMVYEAPWWAGVLAVFTLGAVVVTLLNIVQLSENVPVRFAWWGCISLGAGLSFTALFLPYSTWHTSLLMSLVFGLLILCIDFSHYSETAQSEDSNTVVGLYIMLLITLLATLVDAQWRLPAQLDKLLQWETAMQRQLSILCLNTGMNVILAALLKLKLCEAPVLRPRDISKMHRLREKAGQGTHFGLLCNICVLQGFVSMLILQNNLGMTGPGIMVLSTSILLLLQDDGWLISRVSDPEQLVRYAYPFIAALLLLTYRVVWYEFPWLLRRSPFLFAVQITVFVLALVLGGVSVHDLFVDTAQRRREGGQDMLIVVFSIILFLCAASAGIRWTVAIAVAAAVLPLYNDSFWQQKLSSML
eukprot:Sspe_Gene.4815::Locus_1590_Transcript_1_1_Confidence_1.000_Length_3453::g.4815::m.4815